MMSEGAIEKLLRESISQELRGNLDRVMPEGFVRMLDIFITECRPDVVSLVLMEASAVLDSRAELPHPDAPPELWAAAISRLENDPEWNSAPALAGYHVAARWAVLMERAKLGSRV